LSKKDENLNIQFLLIHYALPLKGFIQYIINKNAIGVPKVPFRLPGEDVVWINV
jgi:hypothetical protein